MSGDRILKEAGETLNQFLTTELREQGHYLTGSLENSINNSSRVEVMRRKYVLRGFALSYSKDLDEGVPSGSRRLPSVDELTGYFRLRGLNLVSARQAAFLTARKHKQEGMPTKASSRFSKTGERKWFLSIAWKKAEPAVDSMIMGRMDKVFENEVKKQKSEKI